MLVRAIFLLAAVPAAVLSAQDLTGTWQGTIHDGNRDVREVIKISSDGDVLNAVLLSIDLVPGQSFRSSPITPQGTAVKIVFPGIAGIYNGTLSADGNSMTGVWTREAPANLNLQRVTPETAWEIPAAPAQPKPMAADADPAFEIATIKLSRPDSFGKGIGIGNRRFSARNESLTDLIAFAYGTRQITGGPAWIGTDRFDIEGEPDGEGQPNERQWKTMVGKLLAARFKLAFHTGSREVAVYAIGVARTTPILTRSTGDPNGIPTLGFRGAGSLFVRNAKIADFAQMMRNVLDRPVIDRTGLVERYDFTLEWRPDEFQFPNAAVRPALPPDNGEARPDLFTAMRQQLGLKLESTKSAVDAIAIDHAERPSEN